MLLLDVNEFNFNMIPIANNTRVLLLAPEDFDDADSDAVVQGLQKRFPECDWAILTGGFQIVVLEKEDK